MTAQKRKDCDTVREGALSPAFALDGAAVEKENFAVWHGEAARAGELALLAACRAGKQLGITWKKDSGGDLIALRQQALALLGEARAPSPLLRTQQILERIAFCRALHDTHPDVLAEDFSPSAHTVTAQANTQSTVATLQGPLFGDALIAFDAILPKAAPLFCQSFSEIGEAVSSGRAAFAILPLEDTVEGKLFRLYELIEHLELRMACTVDVPGREASKSVRFALLYKTDAPKAQPVGEQILECTLFEDDPRSLGELLAAAEAFGFLTRRIDSLPHSWHEDAFVKHIIFKSKGEELGALMLYLTLFMPRAAVTAHYINLTVKE